MYIEIRGIPRSIRLDQAKFSDGNQLKIFCTRNNIQNFEVRVNDCCAIGIVENKTVKNDKRIDWHVSKMRNR